MIELWIKLKVWMEYIIPAIIIALLLIYVCVVRYVGSARQKRKVKFLKANGFECFLKDVPAFGHGAFYAWRDQQHRVCIDERDLRGMTYKDLKKKIKG